jgi:hypothetical protein
MKRIAATIVLLLAATGCASYSAPRAANRVDVRPPVHSSRTSFTAELVPADTVRPGDGGSMAAAASGPSGRVRVVLLDDGMVEYQLSLRLTGSTTYVAGHLLRPDADSLNRVVATLFSDVTLSGRYVQLRGRGTLSRTLRPAELMDDIRLNPGSFVVRIEPRPGLAPELRGTLK